MVAATQHEGAVSPLTREQCYATCSRIYTLVKPQYMREYAVFCLPAHHAEASDLRRRLALTFMLDDPELSRKHPNKALSLPKLVDRVSKDDFSLSPETDFAELQTNLLFLNTAIDNGCFVKTDEPEDERRFNESVDELARLLMVLWKEINDSEMKLSQTELKSLVELVRQRLLFQVRTKRQAKPSIFDLKKRRARSIAQQRQRMAQFLGTVKKEKFKDAKEKEMTPEEFVDAKEKEMTPDEFVDAREKDTTPEEFVDAKETPEEIEELKRSQGEL